MHVTLYQTLPMLSVSEIRGTRPGLSVDALNRAHTHITEHNIYTAKGEKHDRNTGKYTKYCIQQNLDLTTKSVFETTVPVLRS